MRARGPTAGRAIRIRRDRPRGRAGGEVRWADMALGLLVLLALCGCAEDGSLMLDTDDAPGPFDPAVLPTLDSIQETVFSTSCAVQGCHDGSAGNPMALLTKEQSYANLVEYGRADYGVILPSWNCSTPFEAVLRVAPGEPDDSCLVRKIEANGQYQFDPMPPPSSGQPPLSQAKIDAIRQWISDGALP